MNSLFNYELDERQIRMTLRDTDLEFSESAWDDFDKNFTMTNVRTGSEWKMPNIQMNINRNIIVPVFFILALVGISALMFSFIDFKSNKPEQVEKVLTPDASNYKQPAQKIEQPVAKKEEVKKQEEPPQTLAVKPEENKVEVPKQNIQITSNTSVRKAQPEPAPITNTNTESAPVTSQPVIVSNTEEKKETTTEPAVTEKTSPAIIATDTQSHSGKKKRRKRVNTEAIETIKAPSLLGQETATQEPELELRLN